MTEKEILIAAVNILKKYMGRINDRNPRGENWVYTYETLIKDIENFIIDNDIE